MIRRVATPLLAAVALVLGLAAAQAVDRRALPPNARKETARIALGRRLFYDGDLSIDGSMACSTCHLQHHGFAEGQRSHPGVTGEAGRRNVPGLANVGERRSLTWGDGSIRTLEAQALVPMLGTHPVEMGMKGQEAELARRLGRNACYARLFRAAFPQEQGAIGLPTVTRALAAFERSLVSRDAPADRFARGDASAIPAEAQRGAALFRGHCASCHAGPDFTDDRFHAVATGAPDPRDRGLGDVTAKTRDQDRFRTPSLRNVAVAAPYFHDGATETLTEAIRRHKGMTLRSDEEAVLVAYLEALTDKSFLTDPKLAYPDGPCEAD
ncbi:cytochrome-c peroxidase [Sphingobium nicotianae]|uniref:cytochrome-c peroxidase n=1 Tax=Sphingobium nicotianae TaxID=2782607 RepID=UPI002032E36B|nr:cytochrome c peroxidase [Sphingobium nicotianae]